MERELTQAKRGLVLLMSGSQLGHQVGAVVACVVCDDGWQLRRKTGENLFIYFLLLKDSRSLR